MTTEEIKKSIIRYGKHAKTVQNGRRKVQVYEVICPCCGEKISSDLPLEAIGCAVTKRGSATFWHLDHEKKGGMAAVWNSRIQCGGLKRNE